jgi:hypothetical protein
LASWSGRLIQKALRDWYIPWKAAVASDCVKRFTASPVDSAGKPKDCGLSPPNSPYIAHVDCTRVARTDGKVSFTPEEAHRDREFVRKAGLVHQLDPDSGPSHQSPHDRSDVRVVHRDYNDHDSPLWAKKTVRHRGAIHTVLDKYHPPMAVCRSTNRSLYSPPALPLQWQQWFAQTLGAVPEG